MTGVDRILVIRLGAFGNIVQSLGPFAAIRRHHSDSHITLLTTAPYAGWLRTSPYFDAVWVDARPSWWDLRGQIALARRLWGGGFRRVYDLQTSGRSSRYFQLFLPWHRPEWSGIAGGCSHPDADPDRNCLHDVERQAGQLRAAGIASVPPPDLSWLRGQAGRFGLPARFALLVPGSSVHRPNKRWPTDHYAALALRLDRNGIKPVVIGTAGEAPLAAAISRAAPIVDLTGQTDIGDLADLARLAALAVGNDTGPMHLIAATGCPSLVLFSAASDPDLCAPRGPSVRVLRRPSLAEVSADAAFAAAERLLAPVATAAASGALASARSPECARNPSVTRQAADRLTE